MRYFLLIIFYCFLLSFLKAQSTYIAPYTSQVINIDGMPSEASWNTAKWDTLGYTWVGHVPTQEDCSARYKVLWNDSLIFILMEVWDNKLSHWNEQNPLVNYPANDGPEIFIDEDHSGGEHTSSFQAFAYHLSPIGNVVDLDIQSNPILLNNHFNYTWSRSDNHYTWELAMKVYSKDFDLEKNNQELHLQASKVLGFTVAYNDSDFKVGNREHMIASAYIEPWTCSLLGYASSGVNCSWQTADVFNVLKLDGHPLHTEYFSNQNNEHIQTESILTSNIDMSSITKIDCYNFLGQLIYSGHDTVKCMQILNELSYQGQLLNVWIHKLDGRIVKQKIIIP
jgi:hypothetical protein